MASPGAHLKISIVGVGNVGKTLAQKLSGAGHAIYLAVREGSRSKHAAFADSIGAELGSPETAARVSDVLLIATPWAETKNAIESLGDVQGKILIDATNPIAADFSGLEVGQTSSGAELVASWAKGARVVKCFNQIGFDGMARPQFGSAKAVQFVAGDDPQAREVVMGLCRDVGFEAIDAGGLALARQLEPFAWLWIHLALKRGMGRDWAFTISRRGKQTP
jgi:predicted dinucleotide-binding enzyme